MDETSTVGRGWVFTVPGPGGDDTKFREWCAEHPELFVVVTERRARAPQVTLHRASCTHLRPDDAVIGSHLWRCGTRPAVEDAFSESAIIPCQMCL